MDDFLQRLATRFWFQIPFVELMVICKLSLQEASPRAPLSVTNILSKSFFGTKRSQPHSNPVKLWHRHASFVFGRTSWISKFTLRPGTAFYCLEKNSGFPNLTGSHPISNQNPWKVYLVELADHWHYSNTSPFPLSSWIIGMKRYSLRYVLKGSSTVR